MIEKLKQAINKSNADYLDVRTEETSTMQIVYSKDRLQEVVSSFISGGNIRALKNGGIAYRSVTSLNGIDKSVQEAQRAAEVMGGVATSREGLSPAPVVKDKVVPEAKIDPRTVSFEEKKALLEEYRALILSRPEVKALTISYFERLTSETFLNTEGTEIVQDILLCRIGGRIITKDGNRTESVGFSVGFDSDYKKLLKRHDVVESNVKIAVDLLKAEPIKAGIFTIVCDSELGGIFTHEAFGHLSESDDIINNPSLLEAMKIGNVFGKPILNIVDQGNFPGAPGTYRYDHEGVASRKTYLIKEGVLVGRLHSRNSAFRVGGTPTGNYRCCDYRVNPIVRMSNIFIENGQTPLSEMIGSVNDGYYLCAGKGGQTMGDMFTFGAEYGFELKNGKIGKMVKDANISGNVFKTLNNIVEVGNDFRISEGGGCGKSRTALYDLQMLDKSGLGSPHIKIQDVVIGG